MRINLVLVTLFVFIYGCSYSPPDRYINVNKCPVKIVGRVIIRCP